MIPPGEFPRERGQCSAAGDLDHQATAIHVRVVGGLTREAVAERAGVPVRYVDRLVELGILTPGDGGSRFSAGDVRRVRLVHSLEKGLPLEGMGTAVRNGDFSFIDAGPVIVQDGDYFGRTVNTAARIAAHAGPGGGPGQ